MGHSEKTELMCNWSTESEVRKMGEELFLKDHGLEVSKIVERATDSRISINQKQGKIKEHHTQTHHSKSTERQRQRSTKSIYRSKKIHDLQRNITVKVEFYYDFFIRYV